MTSVKFHVQDIPMSMDETMEASPEHSEPCTEDRSYLECEPLSQPLTNVSQDMCLVVKPKSSSLSPLSPSKCADVVSSEDAQYSQTPMGGATTASSQQPSPEFLMSLGIKVRDFAYENTLPAIVPVPRVPRQVQPAPRTLKRLQRDWDNKEGPLNDSIQVRPLSSQTTKKVRSLEREPTEPLQEPVMQYTRTLERITVKRVCSILSPSSRSTLPTSPHTRLPASPPTSPLTPPPSHLESQESKLIQTSTPFPLVVHLENPSVIQLDSESQPLSLHPILYTRFTLDSRSSPSCSPAPSPPLNAPPVPLRSSFLGLPSPIKQSKPDPRDRRRRGGATRTSPPSNRYQLRQRPTSSPRSSSLSRCSPQVHSASKSRQRRTRRAR